MKAKELQQLLASGPLAVEFGKSVVELEAYPEPGMRAMLVGVSFLDDDVAVLKVDYAAFDTNNQVLEQPNYLDADGSPTLTARQAGRYSQTEDLFVMADADLGGIVSALPGPSLALFQEYQAGGHASYVRWLEDQLLAARAAAQ